MSQVEWIDNNRAGARARIPASALGGRTPDGHVIESLGNGTVAVALSAAATKAVVGYGRDDWPTVLVRAGAKVVADGGSGFKGTAKWRVCDTTIASILGISTAELRQRGRYNPAVSDPTDEDWKRRNPSR